MRLVTFGDVVLDVVVVRLETRARDSDARARIVPSAGGSAANFAVWAARQGAEVGFFGQAGDDPVGRQLKTDLAAEGVAVDPPDGGFRLDPLAPTGIILVEVEAGARTMTTDRGANLTVPADLVSEQALARCDWFHLTGYSLFSPAPRAATLVALDTCRRLGRPFSVDPSSFRPLAEYGRDRFLDDVAGATVLFPNLDEATLLTGAEDPARAALLLARRFPVVALKLGPEGCVVASGGRFEAVPAARPARPAIDPTGAGDAFAAGFVCRYLAEDRPSKRLPLPAALRAARAGAGLAARAVGVVGGRGRV